MGASDIVPGVSGGTVALILGIYNDLISNIGTGAKALGNLLKGDLKGFVSKLKSVDWLFLIPLLAGIGSAIVLLAGLIEEGLHEYPEAMAGLFFGLVVGSTVVARTMLKQPTTQHLAIAAVVAVAAFVLLGFQSGPITDPAPPILIGAGALAICAMILPGISGSFILLMIGMYAAVLTAVDERELLDIALVGIGAIAGLALFSSLLNYAIGNHHDMVMAGLIGLMIGSLRVLWPWPNGVGIIESTHDETTGELLVETIDGTGLALPDGEPWALPILLAVAAAVVVIFASRIASPSDAEPSRTKVPTP